MSVWHTKNQKLYKKYEFTNFTEAFEFMKQVALIVDQHGHHPEWNNNYNILEIWLSTHESNSYISDKDYQLAKAIDALEESTIIKHMANNEEKNTTIITDKTDEFKLYTDGGSRGNPGPSAGAYLVFDSSGKVVKKDGYYLGVTTNNQAEYQALRNGIEQASKLGIKNLSVYMDSLLIVNQMKGLYKVKSQELLPIYQSTKKDAAKFNKITFNHVPRELNKQADTEVNKVLDAQHKA